MSKIAWFVWDSMLWETFKEKWHRTKKFRIEILNNHKEWFLFLMYRISFSSLKSHLIYNHLRFSYSVLNLGWLSGYGKLEDVLTNLKWFPIVKYFFLRRGKYLKRSVATWCLILWSIKDPPNIRKRLCVIPNARLNPWNLLGTSIDHLL
jgi:hypothetical protein